MKKLLLAMCSVFMLSSLGTVSVCAAQNADKVYVPTYDETTGKVIVNHDLDKVDVERVPALEKLVEVIDVPESKVDANKIYKKSYNSGKSFKTLDFSDYNGTYGYEYFGTMKNGSGLQALYADIDAAVKAFHVSTSENASDLVAAVVDFSKYGLSEDEAISVWNIYRCDNPLYYWLDYTVGILGQQIVLYTTEAYDTAEERMAYNEIIDKMVDEFVGMVPENASDYTKVLAFHDLIIEKINYAYDESGNPESALWAHNILGVFDSDRAVCEGYSKTFQLLLNYVGIENIYVTGQSIGGAHAWNMVQLDGSWYWMDLTWDDQNWNGSDGVLWKWPAFYDYFCALDSSFLEDHTADRSDRSGVEFLYELPNRDSAPYYSSEILVDELFIADEMSYCRVGFDSVELSWIDKSGDVMIPGTVTYEGNTYKVISVGNRESISSYDSFNVISDQVTSVHLPETVKFVWEKVFCGKGLEAISVNPDNPYFASREGVLFTKSLYTLIQYPLAKADASYAIPDETQIVAYEAFGTVEELNLKELIIGKNTEEFGIPNWFGAGYKDYEIAGSSVGSHVVGELPLIFERMQDGKTIKIADGNPYYLIEEDAIYSYDKGILYLIIDDTTLSFEVPAETRWIEYYDMLDMCTPKLAFMTVEEGNTAYKACDNILYDYDVKEIIHIPMEISGKVVIPDSVTKLPKWEFSNRTKIECVELSNGMKELPLMTFLNCASLKSVKLPSGITNIPNAAFSGCVSLESIVLPDCVQKIDSNAFNNCESLKAIVIPNGIAEIPQSTFMNCKSLENVEFPNSVQKIGNYAFGHCESLEQIEFPNSVKEIGTQAFVNCKNLKTVQYHGSAEEFNQMIFGSGNEYLLRAAWTDQNGDALQCHEYGEWKEISAPTCEQDGRERRTCTSCKQSETRAIPKLGHDYQGNVLVEPSCTGIGAVNYKCTRCSDNYIEKIPAMDHQYGEWSITNAATCTKDGQESRTCVVCKTSEVKPVEKLGHSYEEVIVAPTCTEEGYTKHTCTKCSDSYTDTEVPNLGHAYGAWKEETAATCAETGTEKRICTSCWKSETRSIAKLDHTYETSTTKATLTKNGKKVTACGVCGVESKSETIYRPTSFKLGYTKYTYNGKTKKPTVTVKDSKGNVLENGTDYTVTYASGRKEVGKYKVMIKLKGNYSGTKELSFYILPTKTSKITSTNKTTSIKASWKKVTGASGYKVELLSLKGKVLKTKHTTSLSYTFKELSKVTTYQVRVTSYKTIDKVKYYSLSSKTLKTATAPAAPALKVSAGSKKANLSWKKLTCTGYEITYDTNSKFSSPDGKVSVTKSSTVKKTVSKLKKGKTYYFKMRSYKTVDGVKVYSAYSKVVKVKVK